MIKKLIFLSIMFVVSVGAVFDMNNKVNGLNSGRSRFILGTSDSNLKETAPDPKGSYIFSSLPSFDEQIKTSVKTADARPEIIRQYLHKYNSPLEPQADLIVTLSDQYDFDYRWLVAIAQQESNLCKKIPDNSYNCWGWGIYPEPSNPEVLRVTRFDSYEDALRRIAPQFTKIFLKGKHSKDPLEVMKTYTPPSDGSWAFGVSQFFEHLE